MSRARDLHRRGVRAQYETAARRVDEEGVLHLPGRVVGAEVEGVEVEPLRLELRAFGHLPAYGGEDLADAPHEGDQRVERPGGTAVGGQRDVDGLLDEHPGVPLCLQLGGAPLEGVLHGVTGRADALAGLGTCRGRQGSDLAVGEPQRAGALGVG